MFSITLVVCFLSAQNETATPTYNAKLDFHYVHQFEASIDNGGDVGLTSYGTEFRLDNKMTNSDDLQFRFQFQRDNWDFSGNSGLGQDNPWDSINTVDLALTWTHSYSNSTQWFIGGIGRTSYEQDAKDGTVFGGSVGFIHSFSSDFTLGFGAGVIEQELDDPRWFPVFVLDWQLGTNLKLSSDISTRFGGRTGVELIWDPNENWTVGAGYSYGYSRFRLDNSGIAPKGAGEVTSWPLTLRATYHASPTFDLTFLGGIVFNGQIEVVDQQKTVIERQDFESTGAIGIWGQIRF
jgi:hypothetical protein